MYSKTFELTGIAAISIAISYWARWEAGLLFGGISLLLIGGTINDAAINIGLRRGWSFLRGVWHGQLLKEQLVIDQPGPHPSIRVNAETDRWARSYAKFYANLRPKPDSSTEGARKRDKEPVSETTDELDFERLV